MGRATTPAAAFGALALLALASLAPAAAQTGSDSPLKGYGLPGPNTTEVFVSAYLDRLLNVNDKAYQFESIMYFYLSWTAPEARKQMEAATLRMRNASDGYQCQRPCSSHADNTRCCDGVYIPGFYLKNAYGTSGISFDTYFIGESAVLREVRLQGVYYQAMNFGTFPFDSFDLLTELRFKDTTRDINVSSYGFENMGVGRPRIRVVPSSGDKKLFNLGAGDDANNWKVVGMCLNRYNLSMLDGVKYSERYSDPADPVPLWPDLLNLPSGGFAVGGAANLLLRQDDDIVGIYIRVQRFARSSWMDGILPVLGVFVLGLFVFVLDFEEETHLYNRLQLLVTLFLTLIAVQFVVVDRVPASSYVTPMQQLVLATYGFLCLASLESILLHCYVGSSRKVLWRSVRGVALAPVWLARRLGAAARSCAAPGTRPPAAAARGEQLQPHQQLGGGVPPAGSVVESEKDKLSSLGSSHCSSERPPDPQQAEAGFAGGRVPLVRLLSPARARARLLRWSYSLGEVCLCDSGECPCKDGPCPCKEGNCPCTAPACDCRLGRCPCRVRRHDAIRRKRTANLADNVVFVALAGGYTLAAVLIFTLQSGYTALFPTSDDRGTTACTAAL